MNDDRLNLVATVAGEVIAFAVFEAGLWLLDYLGHVMLGIHEGLGWKDALVLWTSGLVGWILALGARKWLQVRKPKSEDE
jgi:hypothetical protein